MKYRIKKLPNWLVKKKSKFGYPTKEGDILTLKEMTFKDQNYYYNADLEDITNGNATWQYLQKDIENDPNHFQYV